MTGLFDLSGKVALITGGAQGLGRMISEGLLKAGATVAITSRKEDVCNTAAAEMSSLGVCIPLPCDLSSPEAAVDLANRLRAACGDKLHILVNNAGISAHGRFVDATADRLRQIMEVNFFAATELMREALPLLQQGRQPMVVNVGSILGHRGLPFTTDYCASKFALHGFSEAVRPELKQLGIDMLVVAPATTRTELNDRLIEKTDERPWKEPRGVSADHVARAAVRAIRRGQREIVPSWSGWWLVALNRWFPSIVDRIADRYG